MLGMKVLPFVLAIGHVQCFRTLDQWNSLYHSDARNHFSSDTHLSVAHDQYLSHIKHRSYPFAKAHHPYIVQFPANCGKKCHDDIINAVGDKSHQVISSSFAQISATTDMAKAVQARLGDTVVVDMVPMIPQLKVEKHTRTLSKTCTPSSHIDLLVVFGSMPELDISSLQTSLDGMVDSFPGMVLMIGPSGLKPDRENMITVQVPCSHLDEAFISLSKLPHTVWIEQQEVFLPSNRWANALCQSGSDDSRPLFDINISGQGLVVGVSDTGIDMTHCHFYDPDNGTPFDRVNTNHRKVIYYNSFGDKSDDSDGHGTHVSSSVAGKSMITYGDFVKYDGSAKDAKIAFFDVGETGRSKLTIPSNMVDDLFLPLYNAGAKISTHSWGSSVAENGNNNKYTANARSVDLFMRDYPDALIFFAAGNEGISVGANSVGSPATNKNGVSVGASLNSHDSWRAMTAGKANKNQYSEVYMAGFSSIGPTEDGRLKPDIAAPGWTINAAKAIAGAENGHCDITSNQGTSMASPTAAGNAVLVQQYFLEGWYPSGTKSASDGFVPSGALIKAMLITSGTSMEFTTLSDGKQVTTGGYPSNKQGYGRISLNKVLNFGPSSVDQISLFVVGAASSGHSMYAAITNPSEAHNYTFTTSTDQDQTPIRITLCYTDDVGTSGSISAYVINDLSIMVTSGEDTFPPLLEADRDINNIEMVVIENPQPNTTYFVSVVADYLNSVQPYALVIAGSVEVATVNRTAQKSDQVAYASSQIISSATMEIITVLGIAVVTMGILLSVITVQNRPSNRAAREEARQVAVVQRLSAQEAYSSDLQRVEHRELTQSELDRISRL